MQEDRLLLDTSYFIAIHSRSDDYHEKAMELMHRVESAREVVITEAILVELGTAFPTDRWNLLRASIDACYATPNVTVVPIDEALLKRVLAAYEGYADKIWSLTDCISFVVMKDRGITEAATSDSDFTQASFSALLR